MSVASPATTETARQSPSRQIVSDSLAMGMVFALILTVVQRGVGFLRGILFCRLMTEQQLGQWSLVWSFLMLLAPLAALGLPGCFGRFVEDYRQSAQLATFLRRITRVCSVVTLALAAAMMLAPSWFGEVLLRDPGNRQVIYAMSFALIWVALFNYLTSLVEALRQIRLVTLMRFILGVLFALLSISILNVWQAGATVATLSYGFACALGSIPAIWFLWRHREALRDDGIPLSHSEMWRRIAPFAGWLWMVNITSNLFEVSDRYMLVYWTSGPAELAHGLVGQYHSGRVIPLLLVGVATVLEGLLMPYLTAAWVAQRFDQARQQLNLTLKLVGVAFVLGSGLLLALAPWVFDTVLQGRYAAGLEVLPLALAYCVWFSLFLVAQSYLWVAEKGSWVFATTLIGLSLNLALNAWWIPQFGLWGAVWATTSATLVCLLLIGIGNRLAGCCDDRGVRWVIAAPAILLLPGPWLWIAFATVALTAITTRLVFTSEERTLGQKQLANWLSRFQAD